MALEPEPPEPPEPLPLSAEAAVTADQAVKHGTEEHAPGHHGPFHTHCENCGTKLEGPWCHRCGQHDFEFHRSFRHVFMEALETLFHFEGKFFRNIVTLLFQPGRLTADFNAGKRAAQMPPFRLYIFVSFVFFLLIFIGEKDDSFVRETEGKPHQGLTIGGKPVNVATLGNAWRDTATQMKPEDWQDPAKVTAALEQVAAKTEAAGPAADPADGTAPPKRLVDEVRESAEQMQAEIAKARAEPGQTREEDTALERFLEEQGRRLTDPERRRQLSHWIQSHLPHMLMFCLPFFALYTRVLFRKSGQVYLQHLVLSVHFHTFIYLWVLLSRGWEGLAGLPGWGLDSWVAFACNFWLGIYPFVMLRRLFANSWPKTVVKTFLLTVIYGLTLSLGFFATAVGAFLLT
ncbi:DUF3667 domain-containing protein [Oleiharenicola lentus]|uniref:DUF3667 domain-containing protein n=1 Tax=Oleiharenicola lentus TaxID=2508720 RepID=A0A4Q1C630_9BACT|nr:DUF3667 domain-containing protein [Oleiharenicola lentus]RXK53847.1 DUF3667 domain-containing protein [Oleiharenicola lentus]